MSELKACPFCGGEVEVWHIGNTKTKSRKVIAKCKGCRAQRTDSAIYHDFDWLDEITKKQWNTRPLEDALLKRTESAEADNKRLREIVDELGRKVAELETVLTKASFIKFENEDCLPEDIPDKVYDAMFTCSHVDGVRLFPYIEENGDKYFLIGINPAQDSPSC